VISQERGFTLVELGAAITLIAVLAAVLLGRLAHYQELAEKAKMDSELRTIKTGLQIRLAELIVTHRQAEAAMLESEDPIRWLDDKPANYGGAYPERPRSGTWYFDASAGQLVYVVDTGRRLELESTVEPKQLRFRARLLRDRVRVTGGTVESVTGVALVPASAYRWP
jgi:prepilin-type N-terminal cleavage/methylation domain-containing protein